MSPHKCQWMMTVNGGRLIAPCASPAITSTVVKVDDYTFVGEFCAEHKGSIRADVVRRGFEVMDMHAPNGRKLTVYFAASGLPFTASDAREWLMETGRLPQASSLGRLSDELIEEFARAH